MNEYKKNEIEKIFIKLITKIGIDIPSNFEDIAQFIYEVYAKLPIKRIGMMMILQLDLDVGLSLMLPKNLNQ